MNRIAIIGGTGLTSLSGIEITKTEVMETPYGDPSSALSHARFGNGQLSEKEIVFLPRHGNPHCIPPHKVNYRANIYALKQADVDCIIAVNAVGGITSEMFPGRIVIPDQIIDYTYDRKQTFFEDDLNKVTHTDFTYPYSRSLRKKLSDDQVIEDLNVYTNAVYAATQGPRLETAAEVNKLEKDGCDIVGMTGMPEAALAREMNIEYASVCLVVNWAAGKTEELITMTLIEKHLQEGMEKIKLLLERFISIQ